MLSADGLALPMLRRFGVTNVASTVVLISTINVHYNPKDNVHLQAVCETSVFDLSRVRSSEPLWATSFGDHTIL